MLSDIDLHLKSCQCLKSKMPNRKQYAPMGHLSSTAPFDMLSIDFLELDPAGGYRYALVVIDHFTRFCQIYPTRNRLAKTAAGKIFNDLVLRFGFPTRIHHDQGPEFESQLMRQLHKLSGVKMSHTTHYHPMGDGQVEGLNRTIINMLKNLAREQKSRWYEHLNKLSFVYNWTRNDSTGFSPYYLLFGRSPRLPVDLMFESVSVSPKSSSRKNYVVEWEKGMREAYKIAAENSKKAASYNKGHHDKRIHGMALKPGDRVLVRNSSERGGTGKLRNYREEKVHVVIDRRKESPVYALKAEDGSGIERILHRNLLLPCDLLLFEGTLRSDNRKEKSKSSFYHRKKNSVGSETSDSDSSCDYNVYRVVSDEVTKSFPVSQQAIPLVDSLSHHDLMNQTILTTRMSFQLIQISKLLQMILKNSTVKKLMKSRTLKS